VVGERKVRLDREEDGDSQEILIPIHILSAPIGPSLHVNFNDQKYLSLVHTSPSSQETTQIFKIWEVTMLYR